MLQQDWTKFRNHSTAEEKTIWNLDTKMFTSFVRQVGNNMVSMAAMVILLHKLLLVISSIKP